MAEGQKKRIVIIAIDDSSFSEYAFNFYSKHLHKPDSELLLLHSGDLPHMTSSYSMYATGTMWEELLTKEKETVKKLEDKYADLMKADGLTGKIKAVFGNRPGEFIVHEAKESKCALIVMGTRGLGSVRRTILGSVSDYVVHHAHCPVVVCRQ